MVLVSHRYKFIYFKNLKVAGTSVESFFGQFCVDPSKKYTYQGQADQQISKYGILGGRGGGKGNQWMRHKSAKKVKRDLGSQKFNSYFKFCVVRNPWDKVVSQFFFANPGKNSVSAFNRHIARKNIGTKNWGAHTLNDKPICDYYIRFENLESGIKEVCRKLGIKPDLANFPQFKSQYRPRARKDYHSMYSTKTRKLIRERHKKEIQYFGYKY